MRKKKIPPPPPPPKPVVASVCAIVGCPEKPTRIAMKGFCTSHFYQIKRGLLAEDGKPTGKALKIQKRQALKNWAQIKEEIGELLTMPKLKVLQDSYPETTKPVWCEAMDFWTCEAACFSRMFLWDLVPEECAKCHQNDERLGWLKDFSERVEEKA